MVKRNFNGGGWREAMTSNAAYGSTSGSTSGSSSNIPDRGRGQSSNQQADKINQARKDRQQAERDWAGEFTNVPSGPTNRFGHEEVYVPFKSSVHGLKSNQPYTYKTQAEIDRDRKLYQSETSMKEGIAGALGGLDYSSWDDPDKSREDWDLKDGRLWDPFVKGYDPEGNPIKWTDDDISSVFMRGEFGFPNYPTILQGGGGGGGYGDSWGSGGGGGGGYGGGGGGYGPPEKPQFPGQPGERWGAQMPLQQAMINIHGGQGFQQGFARGGIVSLVE